MTISEERALSVVESRAVVVAPLDALATMSDAEFETRLAGLKKAQDRMKAIQREIMTPDIDYGVIPGTGGKPTLLKPGAEVLCKFHHLVPIFRQETIIGDGVIAPSIRILSTCSLHLESEEGPIVAQGIGSANSWEKKYRYREGQRKCPECGAAAIIKGRVEYGGGWLCFGKKGGCGAKFKDDDRTITDQQLGQIENPDPYDTENTLEKMSAKRAQVDATLRATATSGLFTQDVEDMDIAPAKETPAVQPAPARQAPAQAVKSSPKPAAPAPDLLCGKCHKDIYATSHMTAAQVADVTYKAMQKLAENDPTITPVQCCDNCYKSFKLDYDAARNRQADEADRQALDQF